MYTKLELTAKAGRTGYLKVSKVEKGHGLAALETLRYLKQAALDTFRELGQAALDNKLDLGQVASDTKIYPRQNALVT